MMLMTGRRVGIRLALAARKLLAAYVWMSFIVPGWARPGESENLVVAVPVANLYSRASDDSDVVSINVAACRKRSAASMWRNHWE